MPDEVLNQPETNQILIVDDSLDSLKVLQDILLEQGYLVRPASGAEVALRSAEARVPDLIMLDVKMPGMDGYEACRILKSRAATRLVPVIFISGLADTGDKVKGFEAGGVDYIIKPFEPREVAARVRTHLNLRRLQMEKDHLLARMEERIQSRTGELENANSALRESEQRYRGMFENSPVSIWEEDFSDVKIYLDSLRNKAVTDIGAYLDTHPREIAKCAGMVRVLDVNRSGINLHRASDKEDLLLNLELTFTPASYAAFKKELVAVWNGDTHVNLDGCVKTLDGEVRFVKVDWQVVPGFERTLERVLVSLTDITDLRRAEDETRNLQQYLQSIVDSMPSALVGVDRDGKVVQWNRRAEEMAGMAGNQARGRSLGEVFPLLEFEMPGIRKALLNGTSVKNSKVPVEIDGKQLFLDITVYPLRDTGNGNAVIRVDEVTERVNMEEMMIQSEKVLSVGGLAAGMAHEINNPLAGMIQNSQVILNRLTGDLPVNHRVAEACGTRMENIGDFIENRGILDMLRAIRASGEQAAVIVKNMLSFCRRSRDEFTLCSLPDLMEKTLEIASSDYDLKKRYDFRKIEIVREYQDDLPLVRCEGLKIQQVILNLLRNAAEAAADVEISHEPPRIVLRILKEGDMVRMEVADNGPGMCEKVRKRVFEPFFTTKGVGVGTGLGLSVSYFIITENHGGSMSVESKPNKGARFILRLPQGKSDGRSAPPE